MTRVAIIGFGISGIAAASACVEQSLHFVVFERRTKPGGIWSTQDTPVFDNLTTNTAVFEMFYSDYQPARIGKDSSGPHQNLCVSKPDMYHYLCEFTKDRNLLDHVLFGTTVTCVDVVKGSSPRTFVVRYNGENDGESLEQTFDHVIVATGNFDTPYMPSPSEMPGISLFKGTKFHVSAYKNPSQVRGKKVLMVGGSHSALEAVADMLSAPESEGARSVTVATRTMRQIIVKQRAEQMLCSHYSTRYALFRMLAGRLTAEQLLKEMKRFFVDHEKIGAPLPNVPLIVPPFLGFTVVNGSLIDAISEGRSLNWKVGGVREVTEHGAEFVDGSCEQFDAIVFATGYKVQAPCLSEWMQEIITPADGANTLELYDYTFHPDLKGVSFVGIIPPGTSSFPMFENQARWVASTICGQVPYVDELTMRRKIEQKQRARKQHECIELTLGFQVLDLFAEHGGFAVDFGEHLELSKALLLGPLCPSQFRMFGHGRRENAKALFERQIEAGGFVAGDNSVDTSTADELEIVSEVLVQKGLAPKGLQAAVQHIVHGCTNRG